jgi:hypothetical protein
MKHVTLEGYSWSEIAWLGEMITEKLADMGYEGVGSFHFSVEVEFEEAEEEDEPSMETLMWQGRLEREEEDA